jgi:hypothetical protein
LDATLRAWAQLSAEEQAQRTGPFADVPLTGAGVFYPAARTLAGLAGPDGAAGDPAALEAAIARLRAARNDFSVRLSLDMSTLN